MSIEEQADHSGTTGMTAHHNALAVASEPALEVERRAVDIMTIDSSIAVGTVGEFDAEPNVVSAVPDVVSLCLDPRSVDHEETRLQSDAIERALDAIKAHCGVTTSFNCIYDVPLMPLPEHCRQVTTEAPRVRDIETLLLHSGASRDTMQVADVTDAAFVFVAPENDYSYLLRERADWIDCTAAVEVLTGTLAGLATTDDTETDDTERD